MLALSFDITERKAVEAALATNQTRLRAQKETFQAAIDGAPLDACLRIVARLITDEPGVRPAPRLPCRRRRAALHPIR